MNEEQIEAALWYQGDAAYLARCAADYREDGNDFMAVRVQQNAAHSARMAREEMGIEVAEADDFVGGLWV